MKICFVNPTVELRRPIAELARILSGRHEITVVWPRLRKDGVADIFHFSDLKNGNTGDNDSDGSNDKNSDNDYSNRAGNITVKEIPCVQPHGEFSFPIPFYSGFSGDMADLVRNQDIIHIWTYFYPLTNIPLLMRNIVGRGNIVGMGNGGNGGLRNARNGKSGAKIVLTSDTFPSFSFDPGGLAAPLMKLYARVFGRTIFSATDRVAIYGDSMRPFAGAAGVPDSRTIILPSGVHTDRFGNAVTNGIRNELGMEEDEKLILFTGMIVPRKGIDVALKTAAIMKRRIDRESGTGRKGRGERFRMLFCGRGSLMPSYRRMARRLGIEDLVHFAGARRDIPEIMASSDALFLPSRGEGLPGVVMEAAAAGLPTVASRIPCIPDLIEHGETGLMVKMDDANGFALALSELLGDDEKRLKMGSMARGKIREWDWKYVVPRYEKLYSDLLEE